MAIRVEGDKNVGGLVRMIGIGIAVLFLVFGTYYLFFKNPPLVEVLVPEELETISKYSEIEIEPTEVINSSLYNSLIEHVPPPAVNEFGRENPFSRF